MLSRRYTLAVSSAIATACTASPAGRCTRTTRLRFEMKARWGSAKRCKVGLTLALTLSLAAAPVRPAGAQSITFTNLHSFSGSEGTSVQSGLIQGRDGDFYGTTYAGGASNNGTIFKITPGGTLTVLHSFAGGPTEGLWPMTGLVQGSDGNFYGTTQYGGANYYGTVYQITPTGAFTVLHHFTPLTWNGAVWANPDGAAPEAGLVQGSDGNLYGTATAGGSYGHGTVFQITPGGAWTTLYNFTAPAWNGTANANADGAYPLAALVLAGDSNFYGATYAGGANGLGTLFRITPGGALTTLHSLAYSEGYMPFQPLLQAGDGNFYGTLNRGGANDDGSVFRMTPAGAFTVLYNFTVLDPTYYTNADGANPDAPLLQGRDGNLYGTASVGGAGATGAVFKITLAGVFTVLHAFAPLDPGTSNNADGAYPAGALVQSSDGSFYGAAYSGGAYGFGAMFQFTLTEPVLSSLSPASADAGGAAFTLVVKGSNFPNSSVVDWDGTALATTYVSSTQLKASVPASLIANPGTAQVSVTTPNAGNSASQTFTIRTTTLKLASATLTRNSTTGVLTAKITLKNTGHLSASNVSIVTSTLGTTATSTSLPLSLGSIAASATTSHALAYPGTAGKRGVKVSLKVAGTFDGGTFSGSLTVILP